VPGTVVVVFVEVGTLEVVFEEDGAIEVGAFDAKRSMRQAVK
jgi:hypothetical protein